MMRSNLVIVLLVSVWSLVSSQDPQATFSTGTVEGVRLDVQGQTVDAFLGIPYAEPPTGDLRFKAPVPKENWVDTLSAQEYGSSCPQFAGPPEGPQTLVGQEDCLFLNMWVPNPRQTDTPVLVWIHGGGYSMGTASSNDTDGRYLVAETGLIVISMNYRLGSLGFLALDPTEAPGNMGLRDQALALQWLRDNIGFVGGDPDQITIFGQSNGASDVGLHMLSPVSRPLFARGALAGGSALARWDYGTFEAGVGFAYALAKTVECDVNTVGETLPADKVAACLRSVDLDDIINNQGIPAGNLDTPWKPVIDGNFLMQDPVMAVKKGDIKNCEVLIGYNKNEAYIFVTRADGFSAEGMNATEFVESLRFLFPEANSLGVDAIEFEYTPWEEPDKGVGDGLRDATEKTLTDVIFKCPAVAFARGCAANGQSVHFYQFADRASASTTPEWMGVVHGAENNYTFGLPTDPAKGYTDDEADLSRKIMTYWGNFAKTGNPNKAQTSDPDGPWPMYTVEGQEYLVVDRGLVNDSYTIGTGPDNRRCAFWKKYFPTLQAKTIDLDEAETVWKTQLADWRKEMADWEYEMTRYEEGQQCNIV